MEEVTVGEAQIPRLGVGTWMNTGQRCVETVATALDLGYRHVDTAQIYGNEAAVGAGIEAATVDRDEVFLTTKLKRGNLRADAVTDSVQKSLAKLDTGYVDLLLIHRPHPRVPVAETLRAMAELRDDGVVRHLGVSNFTRTQLEAAREATNVPLVTDQVMYHPYKDQRDLQEYCVEHGIALTAYSPLARGDVLDDRRLQEIGDRYGKSAAQVALRWLVQQEYVVAIPKATSRGHLEENLAVFDFELTDEEMGTITDISPGVRRRIRNLAPAVMRHNPF